MKSIYLRSLFKVCQNSARNHLVSSFLYWHSFNCQAVHIVGLSRIFCLHRLTLVNSNFHHFNNFHTFFYFFQIFQLVGIEFFVVVFRVTLLFLQYHTYYVFFSPLFYLSIFQLKIYHIFYLFLHTHTHNFYLIDLLYYITFNKCFSGPRFIIFLIMLTLGLICSCLRSMRYSVGMFAP